MKRTVYILGAGCSVKYGYPLAKDFVNSLEAFGGSLGEDAQQVRRCVRDTVALMRERAIRTLDDLTSRIDNGVLDEPGRVTPQVYTKRYHRIRDAKIATYALFLSMESAAGRTGLAGYHDFILKLFPGTGNWHQRSQQTECHVLTFNYDRLFEMAFLSRFGMNTDFYRGLVLNSGFNDVLGQAVSFDEQRFSFLKLHGSVGVRVREEYGQPQYYPYIDGIRPEKVIEIKDSRFFSDDPNPNNSPPEPLIVFPFEKHNLQSGRETSLPFRDYIPQVWERAKAVVAQATEIWVIGYSFATLDRRPTVQLLAEARSCKRIVIQNLNGEAEAICTKLRVEHPEIGIPLEPYPCGF